MPCTAQYSRGSKISPVASNKKAATYIELIFSFLIFTVLLIPVAACIQFLNRPETNLKESVFLSKIRHQISRTSSESLNYLKESKIVYNKGDEVNGFVFDNELRLNFTVYGQIKQGKSVFLDSENERYRLTIRPITGFVNLERE